MKESEILDIPEGTWAVFNISCNEDEELDIITKIWKRLSEYSINPRNVVKASLLL